MEKRQEEPASTPTPTPAPPVDSGETGLGRAAQVCASVGPGGRPALCGPLLYAVF